MEECHTLAHSTTGKKHFCLYFNSLHNMCGVKYCPSLVMDISLQLALKEKSYDNSMML